MGYRAERGSQKQDTEREVGGGCREESTDGSLGAQEVSDLKIHEEAVVAEG